MGEDYIRTARAKGLSERKVIMKHGLRASLTPIVTMFGMDVALLIGGAVITETVFNWQGVGSWVIRATFTANLPVVVAVVLMGAVAVVDHEPDRRHRLRLPRPAGALPVSTHRGEVLLEVDDLSVEFPTPDGVVNAVDHLSFTLSRGETFGIVGESGSGKSVTNLAMLGLLNRKTTQIFGTGPVQGQRSPGDARATSCGQLRGKEIAMIFQDPFACLHPMYRVGDQLVEAVRVHDKLPKSQAATRAVELLGAVGIPNPQGAPHATTRTSSPAACVSAR